MHKHPNGPTTARTYAMDGAYHLSEFIHEQWPRPDQWVEIDRFPTLDAARTAAQAAYIRHARMLTITRDERVILAYHDYHEVPLVDDL